MFWDKEPCLVLLIEDDRLQIPELFFDFTKGTPLPQHTHPAARAQPLPEGGRISCTSQDLDHKNSELKTRMLRAGH